MSKELISRMWANRKALINTITAGAIIGKSIADFARKDRFSKFIAVTELAIGISAAMINSGIADRAVSTIANHTPTDDGDDYDDDEVYDPDEEEEIGAEYDEDGLNPMEFDKFINSGESTEYDDGSDDVGGDHGEDSEEE